MKRFRLLAILEFLISLIVAIVLTASTTTAATITSAQSGNWSAASTWMVTRTGTITTTAGNTMVLVYNGLPYSEVSAGDVIRLTNGTYIGTVASVYQYNMFYLTSGAPSTISYPGVAYASSIVPGSSDNVTIASGHTVSLDVSPTINGSLTVNGTLDAGTNNVSGTGNFTLAGGATLKTANTSGVNGSVAISGTRSLSTGANFEFNGSSAQATGALMPTTVNNLIINNSAAAVSLNQSTTVNGTLALTSGTFVVGSHTLTIAGISVTRGTGAIDATNSSALVAFTNTSPLTLPASVFSSVNVAAMTIDGAGVTLGSDVTISFNWLTMTAGDLTTGPSNTLTIGSNANIRGEGSGHYVVGNLTATESVGKGSWPLSGMGVSINSGTDNLGNVTVTRVSGAAGAITSGGNTGINRNWTITSTNPPTSGRNLTLSWVSDDDNGKTLSSMQLWKSTDNGTTWFTVGSVQDASSSRSLTVSTTSFSKWTVSSTDASLPVQATAFKAMADFGSVTLSWQTQSEVANAGFNVLRQELRTPNNEQGTLNWKLVGSYTTDDSLKGLGTSTVGRTYSFTDTRVEAGIRYTYKIQSVSTSGGVEDLNTMSVTVDVPKTYTLYQNYPNPFNPSTTITYDVPKTSQVVVTIYDVLGRQVKTLVNEDQNPGEYKVVFDASKYPSGVYFYRIVAVGNDGQKFSAIKKFTLMK